MKRKRGFTLIEVMVSLGISLWIVTVNLTSAAVANRARKNLEAELEAARPVIECLHALREGRATECPDAQ